jgi:hypothetical protein
MAFTESLLLQKGHFLYFQQKTVFIQEILFSFLKWGTLAQKKGTLFTLKKVVGHMPPLPPGSAAPAIVNSEDG